MVSTKLTLGQIDPNLNIVNLLSHIFTGWNKLNSFYYNSKQSALNTHDFNYISNYASFDRDGINLLDSTCIFADDTSNIKYISKEVTDNDGYFPSEELSTGFRPKILILDIYSFLEYGLTFYFKTSDEIEFELHLEYEDGSTMIIDNYSENRAITQTKSPIFISSDLISKKNSNIYATNIKLYINKMNVANAAFCFYGIQFGKDVPIKSWVGDLVCFHDAHIPSDDLSIGTLEATVSFDEEIFSGQEISIEMQKKEYHNEEEYEIKYSNVYIISEIENLSDKLNLKQLRCDDFISILDSFYYERNAYATFPASPSEIELITGVPIIFDDHLEKNGELVEYLTGKLKAKETTCRQWLASYSTIFNNPFTTFNTPYAIQEIQINEDMRNAKIIFPDKILGTVNITKNKKYKGVSVEQVLYNNAGSTVFDDSASYYLPSEEYNMYTLGLYTPHAEIWSYITTNDAQPINYRQKVINQLSNMANFSCFNGDELEATIIYNGETIGDLVAIFLKYDSFLNQMMDKISESWNTYEGLLFDRGYLALGIITSIELQIGHNVIANIHIKTVPPLIIV